MTFEDWVKNFTKVYICRLFEAGKWHQYTMQGSWPALRDQSLYLDKINSGENIKQSTGGGWFLNQQFCITVEERTKLFISLIQIQNYLPANFLLVKTNSKSKRIFQLNECDIVLTASKGIQRFPQKEISGCVTLFPTQGSQKVYYMLIGFSEMPPVQD